MARDEVLKPEGGRGDVNVRCGGRNRDSASGGRETVNCRGTLSEGNVQNAGTGRKLRLPPLPNLGSKKGDTHNLTGGK